MADTTEQVTAQLRRFVEHCDKLDREGGDGPEIAATLRGLVVSDKCSLGNAIEAIETAEALATEKMLGEVTDEQVTALARQMAMRHITGVAG